MPDLLKKIAKFFVYKEPKSKELGFELLESDNEGDSSINSQGTSNTRKSESNKSNGEQQKRTYKENSKTQQNPNKDRESNSNYSSKTDQEKKMEQQGDAPEKSNREQPDDQQPGDQETKDNSEEKESERKKPHERKRSRKIQSAVVLADTKGEPASRQKEDSDNNDQKAKTISTNLKENLETIQQSFLLPKNQDIIIREFKIGRKKKAFMVYMEGMMDKQTLNLAIFPKLMSGDACEESEEVTADYLMENVLSIHGIKKAKNLNDIILQVLGGVSALFVDGCSDCILMETRGYDKRNVESPKTETVVQGSQEGFSEDLRTNVTLIRRIVKNENLITEMLLLGSTNHENCAVLYLDGVANKQIVQEVKKRLKSIKTDILLGDGMIEQFIEDNPYMLFPQVLSTERPDRTASFLIEGQVVVIGDGTPFALAVPVTFFRLFHTSEDSFVRWPTSNFLRLIRLFGLFCAAFLPGIYVAITLYHIEMIPTELLLSIARAKEMVPFPTILEVLMMEVAFELIREGGIRVPSVVGQTLGIVGALILGQAAVTAGLVSPLLVIVVSITGLGSFAIPNYSLSLSVRIVRFAFIFAGAVLGFYGLSLMGVLLIALACSMKSFGVPYFAPIAPKTTENKDVIFKHPIWSQSNNPDTLNTSYSGKKATSKKLWVTKDEQGDSPKDEQGGSPKDEQSDSPKDEQGDSHKDEQGGSHKDEQGGSYKDEQGDSRKDAQGGSRKDEQGNSNKGKQRDK